jgi:hypothetical protein
VHVLSAVAKALSWGSNGSNIKDPVPPDNSVLVHLRAIMRKPFPFSAAEVQKCDKQQQWRNLTLGLRAWASFTKHFTRLGVRT